MVVDTEHEVPPVRAELSKDARLDVLTGNMERMSNQIVMLTETIGTEPIDLDFDKGSQAGSNSVFNPTQSLTQRIKWQKPREGRTAV